MNPLVIKSGIVAVTAVGVILGGVLLNRYFEFPKGLDKELINEKEAILSFSAGSDFLIDTSKQNEVIIKVKATSTKPESKFIGDKWACTIRGIAKEENTSVVLTDTENSGNFDKSAQKTKFTTKLEDMVDEKQKYKAGFVKSCARNRTSEQSKLENLDSEIVVNLKATGLEGAKKYEFSDEDVDSIFEGTWTNPK